MYSEVSNTLYSKQQYVCIYTGTFKNSNKSKSPKSALPLNSSYANIVGESNSKSIEENVFFHFNSSCKCSTISDQIHLLIQILILNMIFSILINVFKYFLFYMHKNSRKDCDAIFDWINLLIFYFDAELLLS